MKFSERIYSRPDYATVKNKLKEYKARMQNTSSYQDFRNAWLDSKKEVEYLEYQEEIIYIRHLCGIDYEESLKEIEIQNNEDPEIYAFRDECNIIAQNSKYANELENEFGKQIFANINSHLAGISPDSLKLQSEELQLKMQYRKLMAGKDRSDDELFYIFKKLIETRCELADSLGYNNYIELGYQRQCRHDYGVNDLTYFRNQIQKYITPICTDIKHRATELTYPSATVRTSNELISAIVDMYKDISYEAGIYIDEVTSKGLYDLDKRKNKRNNIFTCCMLPYERIPFIIGNYSGDGMETGYIVHEFGHGFAFYTAARKQPLYELHRSSPAVNEIHSKTMEHFMYPYLDKFVGKHKNEYIKNHLIHQFDNLVYRCAIDEFEHLMYDKPIRSRRQFCELWADISQKYMPWKEISKDELLQEKCWPRQTHIVETPFYYIEYDIAQISTYEFYNKMKRNHKQAWSDYMKLCSTGGSKSYLELLDIANLSNPFKENTISDICRPIIEELSSLL